MKYISRFFRYQFSAIAVLALILAVFIGWEWLFFAVSCGALAYIDFIEERRENKAKKEE